MNPTMYDPSVTTRLDDNPRRWAPMDPELMKAACNGNVEFLTEDIVISSKTQDYWLSRFIPTQGREPCTGNILHLAVWNNRKTFVTEALSSLPNDVVQQLLTQRETAGELSNSTPALLAIKKRRVGCAEILTEGSRAELIKNLLDDDGNSPLFLAVQNSLLEVAKNLLACQGPLSSRGPSGLTALHVWPRVFLWKFEYGSSAVSEDLFERLHDELTTATEDGLTVLHKWVKICSEWVEMNSESRGVLDAKARKRIALQFESFFEHYGGDAVRLMLATDRNDGNNPLHYTAMCTSEDAAILISRKLIDLYKEYRAELPAQTPEAAPEEQKEASDASTSLQNHDPPWLMKNNNGDTPFLLAIHNKLEKLALHLLSKDPVNSLCFLDDQKNPLVLAAENECDELAKQIMDVIDKNDLQFLPTFSDGSNILRSASTSLRSSPSAWIKACEDGHFSVVRAFVKSSEFRDFCAKERDTPLHHIKFETLEKYEYFLRSDELIGEQKNTQDKDGATPLHKAIERGDRELAEALLKAGADYTIRDKNDKTAMDLIAEKCRGDDEWVKWCKHVRINPVLKFAHARQTKFFFKIRGVLFVVATLIATITFQAGFTLPGGLNQNSGEAILAKKGEFLVFLLADALSLLCSVCVLFGLIWSFLWESEKPVICSIGALIASLGWSLIAFGCGVSTVLPHALGKFIIWVFSVLPLMIFGAVIYQTGNWCLAIITVRRLSKLVNTLPGKVSTLMHNISKIANFRRKASASLNKASEATSTQEHVVQIE